MNKQKSKQPVFLLAGFLLVILFLGGNIKFANSLPLVDDIYEENDTFATAAEIMPNFYYDLVTEDPDYYWMNVMGDQDINVSIYYDPSITWMNVSLMNETGDILEISYTVSEGAERVFIDAIGYDQEITIHVESNYTGINYDMDIWLYGKDFSMFHEDSDTEPNNIQTQAYWLDWNYHTGFIQGDVDWYHIPGVNDGDTVHVYMFYDTSETDLAIEMYDQTGNPHGYFINDFYDGKELIWTAAGSYPEEFLKISGPNSGDDYDLDIWWDFGASNDDWAEPNNDQSIAYWLGWDYHSGL
ncbi:MAG: hypothetical protein ACTSVZ_14145, partial [Promethearchaeota archaeon]